MNRVQKGPLADDQTWTAMLKNVAAAVQREMDREHETEMVKENTVAKQIKFKYLYYYEYYLQRNSTTSLQGLPSSGCKDKWTVFVV